LFVWAALLLGGLAACQKSSRDAHAGLPDTYRPEVHQLLASADRFHDSGNDSLPLIGRRLIALGQLQEDTSLLLEGKIILAAYQWRKSNYTAAMPLALDALGYARQLGMKDKQSELFSIIGNLYKENEDYPSALQAASQAVSLAREIRDTSRWVVALLNQAMFTHSYSMQRQNDSTLAARSLKLYLEDLAIVQKSGKYPGVEIALYDNLSQYYKITGDYRQGIRYGIKGMELARKYDKKISLTYSLNWLGEMYFYQGDREKGLAYLHEAVGIAGEIHNVYREMELYGSLYACYQALGDDKQALAYFSRSQRIRDSLQVEKNVRQIGQLHIQYETGRKDQQIESLAALNREKTKNNLYMSVGLLLLLVFLVFLLFQYRGIRHRNRLLVARNRTIQAQSRQLKLLMKELHHRVKNNLQIVSSLLSLQSSHLTDQEAREAVLTGQQRIEAMSLIHQSLYRGDRPGTINMPEYVGSLIGNILQSFGVAASQCDLQLDVEVGELDIDTALPLGLIINEWVTNAFKHAYPDVARPRLALWLSGNNPIRLEISDNGPGMPPELWKHPDTSFGIRLVQVLARQLKGRCDMVHDGGTKLVLEFPAEREKKADKHRIVDQNTEAWKTKSAY
jgi:two-component sensor histidine kinase